MLSRFLVICLSSMCIFSTYTLAAEPQKSLPPTTNNLNNLALLNQADTWSLDNLNKAEWSDNLEKGYLPVYAKLQVLLSRHYSSSGAIDGTWGLNTVKAISAFQIMKGLSGDGVLDANTWRLLNEVTTQPTFIEYTITAQDLKGPYVQSIPADYAEQSKMKGLYYTRVTEMLGEKFHMDELFLQKINSGASFNKVGEKIIVANVQNILPSNTKTIIAHKGSKQLYLLDQQNKMIASFPATIGSEDNPSPSGMHTISSIVSNPHYSYNPNNFIQGKNLKHLSLPPGPNNPVGSIWIGLSRPSFGIHGTPNPALISKTSSHGCIRLTNWDANNLSKIVRKRMTVKFLE
ncbi:MAG TPA: L,D-transpeptidase [Acinetobacter towneri]|nr:L,D-transpeptidase [Acinetobacter towneri]